MDFKDIRGNMRGLKKCPSCFKYNGFKAKGCRNRDCALNAKNKPQSTNTLDAVTLVGQGDARLFSVKTREKCPESVDTRSFVKITDKVVESDETASIIHRNAICFVDTCKYDSKDDEVTCKHVKEASETAVEAIGLTIKRETLYSITVIPDAEKHTLWQEISTSTASPAVQRINKKIFVVKCEGAATGYVHCELSRDDGGSPFYSCSCKVINILLGLNNTIVMEKEVCRHMMLLSAALNSDSRLQNLHKPHLDLMKHIYSTFDRAVYQIPNTPLTTGIADLGTEIEFISEPRDEFCISDGGNWQNSLDNFVINNMELQDCQIELMDDFQLTDQLDLCADDLIDPLNAPTSTGLLDTIVPPNDQIHFQTIELRMKHPEPSQSARESQAKRRMQKIFQRAKLTYDVQEMDCHVAFEQWLASVVERINLSPDFNDASQTVNLTFTIHSNFFNCLHMRFSKDATKRKLPNKCEVIESGSHAGLVANIFHFASKSEILRIFSNETVSLKMERYFKLKSSSSKYIPTKQQEQHLEHHKGNGKWCPVKPTEYKTFIKMGHHEGSSHFFMIKWIADTLPQSCHGEMVIDFEVGRMKNGLPFP